METGDDMDKTLCTEDVLNAYTLVSPRSLNIFLGISKYMSPNDSPWFCHISAGIEISKALVIERRTNHPANQCEDLGRISRRTFLSKSFSKFLVMLS